MKVTLVFVFCLFVCYQLQSKEESHEWFDHWQKGIVSFHNNEYESAIYEYSLAIDCLELCSPLHLDVYHLYNDRGQSYLSAKSYAQAISDFTRVIESENVPIAQMIRALWGRTSCYAALDDSENFKKDYEKLKVTDPDYPQVQYTKDFIVFRNFNASTLSQKAKEKFCCSMIHLDLCKSKEDILFTKNGVCLVKRRCQCGCEKSLQEYAFERTHGKPCDCCGEKIQLDLEHMISQQKTVGGGNCKYWCDRVAQASFVLCGSTFKNSACRLLCTGVVEAVKEGCHWCCEGDGFYKRCVKPFETFISQVPCDPQFD